MYKKDLIREVAAEMGLPIKDVGEIVNTFLDKISKGLNESGKVIMTGFGSFKVVKTKERAGRNPKTGAEITIPAGVKVRFNPGKELKETLN